MKDKPRVLIIYHSGAGGTQTLAEVYYKKLSMYLVDIQPIKLEYDYKSLNQYDFVIFAFPTYHCEPSTSMMDFIKNMPALHAATKSFVFTTCGLFSGNTLRIFIKKCKAKNIIVCGSAIYRAPASDGALLLPRVPFMFRYQKNIAYKVTSHIQKIKEYIKADSYEEKCPRFKVYTLLNYPNKLLGKAYKHKIRVLKERCINCNQCINNCIRRCWKKDDQYPSCEVKNCEFCFKCIHHCPTEAIVISESIVKKPKLNAKFYKALRDKYFLKE